MPKWDYVCVNLVRSYGMNYRRNGIKMGDWKDKPLFEMMQIMGDDGYEFAAYDGQNYIFKKPAEEELPQRVAPTAQQIAAQQAARAAAQQQGGQPTAQQIAAQQAARAAAQQQGGQQPRPASGVQPLGQPRPASGVQPLGQPRPATGQQPGSGVRSLRPNTPEDE